MIYLINFLGLLSTLLLFYFFWRFLDKRLRPFLIFLGLVILFIIITMNFIFIDDSKYLEFKKTILLVLAVIFYGVTILKVGFFLSTSLFLVFSYYFLGERRWKLILIFSFPFVAIFMYLLHGVLQVYLRDPLLKYIGIMG